MAANFDPINDEGINDINITPFVDVVLVLLVIFMVTAPMLIKESLTIKLPKTSTSDRTKPAKLGISINKNGQILINGQLITLETLEIEANLAISENKNIQALISADQEAMHGDVIKVLDVIKKVGIDNFAFQIERIIHQ